MAILTVGPSGSYATVAAAVAASQDGDVVQVAAGTYVDDFVHVATRITIEAVGGTARLVATVPPPDGKAIMTVDADATVSGLDFSGAAVPDNNGAGIRYEGGDLRLVGCSFHDNQNGLLSSAIPGGTLTIEGCDFSHNGDGSGYTHNLYVGDIATLTVTDSRFTDAVVGHEIKSRAETTVIRNCTIADGPTGNASYSIDLPNGGDALIQGNTIEKGPEAENQTVIHYGGEAIAYAGSRLAIAGNTVTNDLTAHATVLLTNATPITASITGNTFLGVPIATYAVGPAVLTGNATASGPLPDGLSTELGDTGNTVYATGDGDQDVALPSPGMAVVGGSGHLTATGYSHETVVGGAGGLTWNGQDGADQIRTAAGSASTLHLGAAGSVVQSAGTDTVFLNGGNNAIQVTGTATLSGGTGANAIAVDGTAVIDDSGTDTVAVGADANVTISESGIVNLTSNGGTFALSHRSAAEPAADAITVAGGAVRLMALDTGLNVTMAGGGRGATVTLGTGNIDLTSAAPDTIHAGAGMDTVILSGSADLYAGTGTLGVFGRGIQGMATVHGGAGATVIDGDGGNIRFEGGDAPATVEDRLSRTVVVGGSGLLTVHAVGGLLTVEGGSGGIVLDDAAGSQTVTTAAGARDVIDLLGGSTLVSNGADLVRLDDNGNDTVTANGAATIQGGTGASRFVLNGDDVLVTRSDAVDRVTVGGGGRAAVFSGSAYDSVDVDGGRMFYAAGDGSAALMIAGRAQMDHVAGAGARIATDAGSSTIVVSNAAATVDLLGNDHAFGGAGALQVATQGQAFVLFGDGGGTEANTGAATVAAGAGAVTVDSWSGSLVFIGGAGVARVAVEGGDGTVLGGSGNITLQGGSGALAFDAGAGTAVVNPGAGADTVRLGAGAVTVNAWAGQDVLRIVAGEAHGQALVNGFDPGQDLIQLDGYAAGSATAGSYDGGTVLTLTDGTTVRFAGVPALPGF